MEIKKNGIKYKPRIHTYIIRNKICLLGLKKMGCWNTALVWMNKNKLKMNNFSYIFALRKRLGKDNRLIDKSCIPERRKGFIRENNEAMKRYMSTIFSSIFKEWQAPRTLLFSSVFYDFNLLFLRVQIMTECCQDLFWCFQRRVIGHILI